MSGRKIKARKLSIELTCTFGKEVYVSPVSYAAAEEMTKNVAPVTQNIILPYIDKLANNMGLENLETVVEGPPKTLQRLFEKAHAKYDGDHTKISDVGRVRIVVSSIDDLLKFRHYFLGAEPKFDGPNGQLDLRPRIKGHGIRTNDIDVKAFKDFYWEPDAKGRVAMHIKCNIRTQDNMPFEIQVVLSDMLITEDATRGNYLQRRMIEGLAQSENRSLTEMEKIELASLDANTWAQYTDDIERLGLSEIMRPDISAKYDQMFIFGFRPTSGTSLVYSQ